MLVYWLDRGHGQVLCLSSQAEECICQGQIDTALRGVYTLYV